MVNTPRATWTGVGPAPEKLETFSNSPRQILDQNAAGPIRVPKSQRLKVKSVCSPDDVVFILSQALSLSTTFSLSTKPKTKVNIFSSTKDTDTFPLHLLLLLLPPLAFSLSSDFCPSGKPLSRYDFSLLAFGFL